MKKTQQYPVPSWMETVARLLRQYFFESESIDDIAEKSNISRVHLSRSFKKYYAMPAVKYRHYVRISNLRYCLASTTKSLAEISCECGFSDQSQMNRVLLKETGFTPRALRMLLKNF